MTTLLKVACRVISKMATDEKRGSCLQHVLGFPQLNMDCNWRFMSPHTEFTFNACDLAALSVLESHAFVTFNCPVCTDQCAWCKITDDRSTISPSVWTYQHCSPSADNTGHCTAVCPTCCSHTPFDAEALCDATLNLKVKETDVRDFWQKQICIY